MLTGEMYTFAVENPNAKFKRLSNGAVYFFDDIGRLMICDSIKSNYIPELTEEWELLREEVDFMIAINSKKDIKPSGMFGFGPSHYWLNVYSLTLDMVNGKWLVE